MKLRCPINKIECPLLDKGGRTYWCNTNLQPEEFETCPIPKKRDMAIKEMLEEKYKKGV
jgi:hypothetical protein